METVSPTPRKSRRLKWLILGALIIASIAVVVLFFIFDAAAHRVPAEIQARIDALKNAGFPVSAEDLDKLYPPILDDQNSALIYLRATNFTPLTPDLDKWPIYGEPLNFYATNSLPAETKQEIGEYVRQNQGILDRLHQAAALDKAYYELGLKDGFFSTAFIKAPSVEARKQAQFLALAAIYYAEDHQSDLAAQTLIDSSGLARSLEHDPRLTCQFIRFAILGLNCETLELALNRTTFSDDQLRSLASAFQPPPIMDSLKLALITERCEGIWLGQSLIPGQPDEKISFLERLENVYDRIRYYRQSDFGFYLDVMKEFIEATDLPCPKNLESAEQLHSRVDHSPARKRAFGIVLQIVAPKMFESALICQAKLHLAQAALAVERFRLANQGRIPDSLAALVPTYLPSVPIYPFDGQPLRLKPLPRGYLLSPSTSKPGPEITFTVTR